MKTVEKYWEMYFKVTFRGVLETAVDNGSEELWFEKEIPESGTVNGHVTSLHVLLSGLSCRSIGRLET